MYLVWELRLLQREQWLFVLTDWTNAISRQQDDIVPAVSVGRWPTGRRHQATQLCIMVCTGQSAWPLQSDQRHYVAQNTKFHLPIIEFRRLRLQDIMFVWSHKIKSKCRWTIVFLGLTLGESYFVKMESLAPYSTHGTGVNLQSPGTGWSSHIFVMSLRINYHYTFLQVPLQSYILSNEQPMSETDS